MNVQVMIPFHRLKSEKDHVPGDIIEVDAEELARIQSIDINMVMPLKDEEGKKKRAKKSE